MKYAEMFSGRKTAQTEPVPGKVMVMNSAGGYTFQLDNWGRLHRFLILGSDAPTYYSSARKLTKQNAQCILECLKEDGTRTVQDIVAISDAGRAPKNDPAIFALALAASYGDAATRKAALDALPKVCRIGTHLFQFIANVKEHRGWGKTLRRAVANWYNLKEADDLAYQVVKYQQREKWSHRDVLRLSHPSPISPEHDSIFHWVTQGTQKEVHVPLLDAVIEVRKATEKKQVADLILEYNLPREVIPTEWLNEAEIWDALLQKMPLTAMVRNLGKMSQVGLLKPLSNAVAVVTHRLGDADYIRKSRLHPIALLVALRTYAGGGGFRGSLSWDTVPQVTDALDSAFYMAFNHVEPTGKRILIGVDVSGSMGMALGGLPLTCAEGAAAMAMTIAKVESNYYIHGFAGNFIQLPITANMTLHSVLHETQMANFGRTDCAVPMLYALHNNLEVDAFMVITDNETWAGRIHPVQALTEYRKKSGIPARLVVVGMTSTDFTIADPDDAGSMDVVGFDTATPQLVGDFIGGRM